MTFCGRALWLGILCGIFSVLNNNVAIAGASACDWVIAVNGDSLTSRTIANHYAIARNIPSRNIIVLKGVPDSDLITVEQFRELILKPLIESMDKRGLANHVQGIAYSADFPTAINIQSDIASLPNKSEYLTPVGSINGLTYLYRLVLAKNPLYIGFESNLYAARPATQLFLPLCGSEEQVQSLKKMLDESKHDEAAKILETAIGPLEKQIAFPMQYLAAQQWAKAGESEKAIQSLERSIRDGWCYRNQLMNDPAFASIANDKDFIRIAKRCPEKPFDYLSSRGFDARTFYAINTLGSPNPQHGTGYMLSMVLAVTRDLGITKTEAIINLEKSIRSDFTNPDGLFLFTKTSDVRTKTRAPNFAIAIDALKSRGKRARVIEDQLPGRGEQCSGLMIGTSVFSWSKSGAELLPGCIADNLTSLGGAMTTNSQTKATEFLRYGAAASSGAVTEPYSIQNKFPHPMIHVHYVDGLTAAEAFYSSVTCPYQLLIVGDPLCQPFAKPARFVLGRSKTKSMLEMSLSLEGEGKKEEPESMQIFIDGLLLGQAAFEPKVNVNLDGQKVGAFDVRIVTRDASPLQQRFEQSLTFVLDVPGIKPIQLRGPAKWKLSDDQPLKVEVEPYEADVTLFHNEEEVGKIAAGEKLLELSPNRTGYGPVRLRARASLASGKLVESEPILIQVEP